LAVGRVIALQMEDVQSRLKSLEQAAQLLTMPITPGAEPFIPSVMKALQHMTKAIEKQEKSLAALYEAMMEPGVVRALQRAVREP
jgi:uncharacterized protein YjgD (DUF1641 family)